MDRTAFIATCLHEARTAVLKVPSFNPVIATAQACLESNYGRSQLAKQANNLFGVKAGTSWTGPVITLPTREWRGTEWVTVDAKWRAYATRRHAFEDYARLIQRVYPHAVEVRDKPLLFLRALVSGELKYATDPSYVEKVWRVVRDLKLQPEITPERIGKFSTLVLHDLTFADRLEIAFSARPILRGEFIVSKTGPKLDARRQRV